MNRDLPSSAGVKPSSAPPEDHVADRLLDAITRLAAPVCVGIDPVIERLPDELQPRQRDHEQCAAAIGDFARHVIDAVAVHVPCVKVQSACFERYGWQGVRAVEQVLDHARQQGLQVILDAKRGDIGISANHYAAAASQHAHWSTVNSYLGADGIEPFLANGHGAFALVRTSNPGGDALQQRWLDDGTVVCDAVAALVASLGEVYVGRRGYSALGAVVGATKPEDAQRLRALMPQQIFLVPGFGAQGGSVEDVKACFHGSEGAIITASRSVIYAQPTGTNAWQQAVADAAAGLAEQIGAAIGLR